MGWHRTLEISYAEHISHESQNLASKPTHRALSEAHYPHLTRKSVKGKPRDVLPFPTITRKSCLSCTGGAYSSHSMYRAHYRNVQWHPLKRVHSSFQIPARWCMKHSSDPETRENTHLSMEAIQSETEISTSYQFSLDPQLLTLLSRPCSVSRAQLYITCAQLQTSFAAHIENKLHFLALSECRWVTHFVLNKTITAQQIYWSRDMAQKASDPLSLALSLKSHN